MCKAGLGRESYPGPVNVGALACVSMGPYEDKKWSGRWAFARPQVFRDA